MVMVMMMISVFFFFHVSLIAECISGITPFNIKHVIMADAMPSDVLILVNGYRQNSQQIKSHLDQISKEKHHLLC